MWLAFRYSFFLNVAVVEAERYFANLSLYRQTYSVEEPSYISVEPNPLLRNIYNSLPAIQLYFLRTKTLSMPSGTIL